MKKIIALSFFFLSSLSTSELKAQDFEFRLVNKQYLFSQVMSKVGPSIERDMAQYVDSLDYANSAERRAKESLIREGQEKLKTAEGMNLVSSQTTMNLLLNDYNKFIENLELKKQKKYEQLLAPYKKSMNETIQSVADQNNIDHVIPTHDENGKQIVLYFTPQEVEKYDMTLQVLEYLNSN